MGFLSAFARGAAGPGLLQVAQMQQRQQELEAATKARETERDEDRKFRLELARENQTGREELLKLRDELRGGSKGTRSGGGGGDGTDDETAALYQIMQRTGASMPEARNMLESTRQGQNPYKAKGPDGQETGDADVDRYRALNRMVAQALMEGPSNMKAKPDERARARQTDTETDAAVAYGQGDQAAGRTGLLLKGKGEFDSGGSSALTGKAAAGSLDAAKIATEIAQAQKARAEANNVGKTKDDKDKPTDPRKYAEKLVQDAVNDGLLKPEEAPAKIEEVMREFARIGQEGKVTAALREARSRNDVPTLVKELRSKGFTDEQLTKLGITKAEMGGSGPAKKEESGGGMLSSLVDKAKGAADGTRKEGDAYQRIYARWREAGSGGAPLTAAEKAEARRFGLAVKG